jgi:two-component system chemotaxis response regulator CheY
MDYGKVKVLVLEDELSTRRLIRQMLGKIGIPEVFECSDGLQGIQAVLENKPDIVLCDIHMSPVSGHEFLKLVREAKMDWVRTLPVIFLTSDNLSESVTWAKEGGVDGYLIKPVSILTLKARIDAVLARIQPDAGLEPDVDD